MTDTTTALDAAGRPGGNDGAPTGFRGQFGRPTGRLGRLVGHVMAAKSRRRSEWVMSLLPIRPADRVLEIGFGPGVDIRRAAVRAVNGHVAGVDHSEEMVRMARRRNAAAVAAGRVELALGSMASLSFPDASFDIVYAINCFQFAADPAAALGEIRRVLRPGGLVALAIQPRNKAADEETASAVGRRLEALFADAGLKGVRLERKKLWPVSVVCALGRK